MENQGDINEVNPKEYSLECLKISEKAVQALRNNKIHTVGDLLKTTPDELRRFDGLWGEIPKIIDGVHELGFKFNYEVEDELKNIGLSPNACKVLKREGIQTLKQLLEYTPDELRKIRRGGEKTVKEIISVVERLGFRFGAPNASEIDSQFENAIERLKQAYKELQQKQQELELKIKQKTEQLFQARKESPDDSEQIENLEEQLNKMNTEKNKIKSRQDKMISVITDLSIE